MFGRLTPYILVTGVFTFMYAFIPNTKVRLRAALVGGVVAGVLWAAGGALFARFVTSASPTMVIYAGFAIVIAGADLAVHLVADSAGRRATRVLHPESAVLAAWPRRDPAQFESARARRAVDHVPHRQRLSGCATSLDDQQPRGSSRSAGRRARPDSELHSNSENCCCSPRTTRGCRRAIRTRLNSPTCSTPFGKTRRDRRLGRIRDIAPAVEAARKAEHALKESLSGRTVKDLVGEK